MIRSEVGSDQTVRAETNASAVATGRWNMLLYWMSNVGEGSWDRFRNVVAELADVDVDHSRLLRSLRISLSDLGVVDFFIAGSPRWKTLPPLVAGLAGKRNAALLIGARTPSVLSNLQLEAGRHAVAVVREAWHDSPDVIRLEGTSPALGACAAAAGVDYAEDYSRRLAAALIPIPSLIDRPRGDADHAPINWSPRSFDLQSRAWVDGFRPNSACEFTPRHGRPRYFVSNRRRRLMEIGSRRDAVYAAAYAQGVSLATYDPLTCKLSVPLSAPLPEACARAACLSSGHRADVSQGRIVYAGVPRDVGAVVLTVLGQSPSIGEAVTVIRET